MKRIYFALILTVLVCGLMAQNHLNDLYFRDYGDIIRLVLVFDEAPDMQLEPSPGGKQLVMRVNNAALSSKVQDAYAIDGGKVVTSIDNSQQQNQLVITFHTSGKFTHKRPTRGIDANRVVLDIFNVASPTTVSEHMSFASFYATVGYRRSAQKQFDWLAANAGAETDYHYDWGMMLLSQKKTNEAAKHFGMVGPNARRYNDAKRELAKLGQQATREEPATQQKPQTATRQEQKPTPPVQTTPPPASGDEITKRWIEQLSAVNRAEAKRFMLAQAAVTRAMVTNQDTDYEAAERLLGALDSNSPLKKQCEIAYYNLYTAWGKTDKAAEHLQAAGLPVTDSTHWSPSEGASGIFHVRIPFGLALILALLAALAVFFLMLIYYGHKRQKAEPEYKMEDLADHQDDLEENVEEMLSDEETAAEVFGDEPPAGMFEESFHEEPEEEPADEEPEIEPEPEPEPFVEESEEPEPEIEETPEPEALEPEQEEVEIDASAGLGDPEYQKKMILKLNADGWDSEAIAKELQISQREVEFIIKTQS